jgi:hypothetical protein
MECLFQSFDSQVSVDNFDRLSSCVISWLEDSCSPQVGVVLLRWMWLSSVGCGKVYSPWSRTVCIVVGITNLFLHLFEVIPGHTDLGT